MIKQLWNFKNRVVFSFLLLCSSLAVAQTSTVTFTIQDPTGQVFANGTMAYVIVPTGTYNFNGSPLPNQYYTSQTVSLDSTGTGTISGLPRNDFITPINTQWQFTACPNTSSPCTVVNVTINTASQNISSVINAQVPKIQIPIQSVPRAYSDSEIITTIAQGGIYYNVGTTTPGLRLWNGSGFVAVGGGGGGAVNLVQNLDGTATVSPTTGNVVVSLNLSHQNTWLATQTFSGVVLQGVTPSTNPVCPNGTGGQLTTTGCTGSGGGSGTVTSVAVATANGFQGSVANPTTAANITLNLDGTHYLPTTTDQTNWNAKQTAGNYITALTGDVTAAGPGSVGATLVMSVAHTWTGAQSFSDGGGTPNIVKNYNDSTGGEGTYFYVGTTQTGGITDNSIGGNMELFDTAGEWDLCQDSLASCSNNIRFIYNSANNVVQILTSKTAVIGQGSISENINGIYLGGNFSPAPTGSIMNTTNVTTIADTGSVVTKVGGVAMISASPTQVQTGGPIVVGGTTQGMFGTGATLPSPVAGTGGVFIDTSGNVWVEEAGGTLARICDASNGQCTGSGIANATTTPPTTAVAAASGGVDTCDASATTITMTGVTTSMTATFTATTDTSGSTGWNAGLYIRPWISAANTVSYKRCNPTSGSITPASITFNVSAR